MAIDRDMVLRKSTIAIIRKVAPQENIEALIEEADIYLPDTAHFIPNLEVGESIKVACGHIERFPNHIFLNLYERTE